MIMCMVQMQTKLCTVHGMCVFNSKSQHRIFGECIITLLFIARTLLKDL